MRVRVGRRHRPKRADREALKAVFAQDLAAAREKEVAKRRAEAAALQQKLADAGIEHF